MDREFSSKYWNDIISKLKQKFPQLTDTDFQHKEGMEDSMLRMVEYKLRKTKLEMKKLIAQL